MYIEVIKYKLAKNISEEHLLKVANKIHNSWMKDQKGFVKWNIHKDKNKETYTDFVYWQDDDDAKNAEKNMHRIQKINDWYACYDKQSIVCEQVNLLKSFQ